jgi:hypothetical protein
MITEDLVVNWENPPLAWPAKYIEPSAAERARRPRRPGLAKRVWSLVIAVVVVRHRRWVRAP